MSRPRVVIVGNGMAGSRVVEQLRRFDPNHLLEVTVLGAESENPYNRVLLSEVLAGRHRADDIRLTAAGWHESNDIRLQLGSPVTRIDRAAQQVETADRLTYPYDTLVLATGSRPLVPPVTGLVADDNELVAGAFAFRTLTDCTAIEQASLSATRAVVLGGGLLGIEAARGLAGRGVPVILVHLADHLMERQLDAGAGRVLARTLTDLGVTIRLGAAAETVITDAVGAFGGLTLDDGSCVLGDLLVVAAGVRPEVTIARDADLDVEAGIVVDDRMRSITDRRIFAVGECAQHRGQVYGLVAPAWEQAEVVAGQITGANPQSSYRGSRIITRLKAFGIDLASLGDPHADGEDLDIVQVTDPGRGTYARVVLSDNRIVGAIVLGQVAGIGTLTTLFDRNAQLPDDRLRLLLPIDDATESVLQVTKPSTMPGSTIVCRCNGVTKATIQSCILGGARSIKSIAGGTRATTGCGSCVDTVAGILEWLNAAEPPAVDVVTEISTLEEVS